MTKFQFIGVFFAIGLQFISTSSLGAKLLDSTGMMVLGGVPKNNQYILLAIWYIVPAAITFLFMGYFKQFVNEYGIYILSRGSTRINLGFRRNLKVIYITFGVVLSHILVSCLLSWFLGARGYFIGNGQLFFKMLLLYSFSIAVLALLQMTIELWVSPQVALLCTNIFLLSSVILGGLILDEGKNLWMLFLFFPNLGMLFRVDLLMKLSGPMFFLKATACLVIYLIGLVAMTELRIKKMDIL